MFALAMKQAATETATVLIGGIVASSIAETLDAIRHG